MIRITHYMRRSRRGNYSMERLYEDIRKHLPHDIQVKVCVSRFASTGFWRRLYDIARSVGYQGDVNHVTGDIHFVTYLLRKRKTILTIHDCGGLECLTGVKWWFFWFFWFWLPEKRCAALVVISETTKQQLMRHLNCDASRIKVINNFVSSEFKPSPSRFNPDRPRLLQIGTKDNKNLERVAKAISGIQCDLTIIGKLSVAQVEILVANKICYQNLVDLTRSEIVEQYTKCDLVVFVSTYEGFGLPIVEANAVGRPVVTSNILSMPDVAGEAASLVDPFDVSSIRAGILKLIEDAAYRERLVQNGFENVKRFRIEEIAEQHAQLYRDVAGLNTGKSR